MTISHSLHRLFTPESRIQLQFRDAPYWARFARGRSIGYRRGVKGSSWYARIRLKSQTHRQFRLGAADDEATADGKNILTFPQALAAAEQWCSKLDQVAIDRYLGWENKPKYPDLPPPPPYTVGHAMVDFLKWSREHTVSFDRRYYQVRAHILPVFCDTPVADLTPMIIRKWLVELSELPPRVRSGRGCVQQYQIKKVDTEYIRRRQRTANSVLACLKAGLNRAFERGLIEDDTAWTKVKGFRGVDRRKARILEKDEIKKLISACRPDLAQFVAGALMTGCRVSELRLLQVKDFSREDGRVKVQDAKSKEPRAVSLSKEGIKFFEAQTAGKSADDYVFLCRNGIPWCRGGYWRPFQQACAGAGIQPPIRFHDLRHAFASQAVMAGVSLKVVSTQLGHVDTRMVDRYYGRVGSAFIDEVMRDRMPALLPEKMPSRPR